MIRVTLSTRTKVMSEDGKSISDYKEQSWTTFSNTIKEGLLKVAAQLPDEDSLEECWLDIDRKTTLLP